MRQLIAVLALAGIVTAGSASAQTEQAPPADPAKTPAADGQAKPADTKPADAQAKPAAPAQSPAQAQSAADQKAYADAMKVKDPEQKIAALNKAADGMPASSYSVIIMARTEALSLLGRHFPQRTEQIRAQAELILKSRSTSSAYFLIAKTLLERNVMPEYAEEMARKALDLFERETAYTLAQDRAKFQAALGILEVRNGKTAEGDKLLQAATAADSVPSADAPTGLVKMVEEALASWPKGQRQGAVLLALADAAEKRGDIKAAAGYLADASMMAPITAANRRRLDDLYRKSHGGSIDGLEAELDAKYRKLNPLPFKVQPYKPAADRTTRTVLAEMFTGSSCGPCVAADLGFDGMLQRYARKDMALLVYHQHIPGPDPMTNPATKARAKAYGVNSTPSFFFDGGTRLSGGGERSQARTFYDANTALIDKRLAAPPEANVVLRASLNGGVVNATVTVDQVNGDAADLRLHLALVENELSYTGENGVRFHPMVVRQLAGEGYNGFPVPPGKALTIDHRFDVAAVSAEIKKYMDEFIASGTDTIPADEIKFSKPMHQINPSHLSVVAFLQDDKTKQVLQASYVSLEPAGAGAPKGERQ